MNTANNNACQPSDNLEQKVIARYQQVLRVAQNLTEALSLPPEACSAVLSGMTPMLLDEYYKRVGKAIPASPPSSEQSSDNSEESRGH